MVFIDTSNKQMWHQCAENAFESFQITTKGARAYIPFGDAVQRQPERVLFIRGDQLFSRHNNSQSVRKMFPFPAAEFVSGQSFWVEAPQRAQWRRDSIRTEGAHTAPPRSSWSLKHGVGGTRRDRSALRVPDVDCTCKTTRARKGWCCKPAASPGLD